jgi:hypothetical protein
MSSPNGFHTDTGGILYGPYRIFFLLPSGNLGEGLSCIIGTLDLGRDLPMLDKVFCKDPSKATVTLLCRLCKVSCFSCSWNMIRADHH